MDGLTRKEALALLDARFWEPLSQEERFRFQLFEDRLCMPIQVLLEAAAATLGRPVYLHEFTTNNHERMIREYLGQQPAPTFEEIVALIPEEKRIVIHR